ncbi:MAG: hypothetical protein ACLQRH_10735 [Acidimicrobiales bacterium]
MDALDAEHDPVRSGTTPYVDEARRPTWDHEPELFVGGRWTRAQGGDSGTGREYGAEGLEAYVEVKSIAP